MHESEYKGFCINSWFLYSSEKPICSKTKIDLFLLCVKSVGGITKRTRAHLQHTTMFKISFIENRG